MQLILGLMNHAGIKPEEVKVAEVATEQNIDTKVDTGNTFRPNRKMRRANVPADPSAVRVLRRYDKVLGKFYGVPKAFRQHAKRYGYGMEYVCSTLLQHNAIAYKELPKDPENRIFWRKA